MGLESTLHCDAGMDAQVAYGFHQLRDEKPFLASGPLSNKVINSGCPFPHFLQFNSSLLQVNLSDFAYPFLCVLVKFGSA